MNQFDEEYFGISEYEYRAHCVAALFMIEIATSQFFEQDADAHALYDVNVYFNFIESFVPEYGVYDEEANLWVSRALDNSPDNLFSLAFAHSWLRPTLATNLFAPCALLELLSHDEDVNTLIGVACNPYALSHTLERLFLHNNREIQGSVLQNNACPVSILESLCTDSSAKILQSVLEHPNATEEIRAKARLCLNLEHGL